MEKSIAPQPGRENKPHIGIFGRCNAGKSTLLNFITGEPTAIVSPTPGTTTDVVRRGYEIIDFGPVIFMDTAGLDDNSPLGRQRVERTGQTIYQIDLAIVVFRQWGEPERRLVERLSQSSVPYLTLRNVFTDAELPDDKPADQPDKSADLTVDLTGATEVDREEILRAVVSAIPDGSSRAPSMFAGGVGRGDRVLLVCPIDSEAPAGRLILPQVQAIRELLDLHAVAMVAQPEELGSLFGSGYRPKLVVTDSQVFAQVEALTPEGIEITSFSILLATAKGDAELYRQGLEMVDRLRDGDKILIAESCSHQVSCEDIGRVKIPGWLEGYTGKKLSFTIVAGLSPLPDDIQSYAMMIQCGGCMVTRSQLRNRIRRAASAGVAVTNYGMLIRKLTTKDR